MKAVIYARYSSDNQREESIEGQIRECSEYAKYNDMEIVGQYIDRAYSAKKDKRPDFQRMIKDSAVKTGQHKVVGDCYPELFGDFIDHFKRVVIHAADRRRFFPEGQIP